MDEFKVEIPVEVFLSSKENPEHIIITYNFSQDKQIMEVYDARVVPEDNKKIFTRTESFTQGTNDGKGFSFDSETPCDFLEKKIKLLKSLKKSK